MVQVNTLSCIYSLGHLPSWMTLSVSIALQRFPWYSYTFVVCWIRCEFKEVRRSKQSDEQVHACMLSPCRGPRNSLIEVAKLQTAWPPG